MARQDLLKLVVGGQAFAGWKEVDVDVGLDNLAGTFRVAMTERWPEQPERWTIEPGAACEVFIGDDRVSTGWIDKGSWSIAPDRHPIEISGSEKTIDLVDCSAIHAPGSWTNRRLEQIAADLARPFNIGVSARTSTGAPFARFALQQGETVFEAIERMMRQRGVLAVTSAAGELEFRRPGETPAGYSLEHGVNIEEIALDNDVTGRFSAYTLKGNASDGGRPKAEAKDPGVRRHRPLLIVNDDDSSAASLGERAKWEASVNAAKGMRVTATVSGWRAPNGDLYRPDRLVPVKATIIGVEATLLVESVSYQLNDRGARTQLTLVPKEAYSLLAIPEPKARRGTATTSPSGQ